MNKLPNIFFYVGEVVLLLIGVIHLLTHFMGSPQPTNDNQRKFLELFSTTTFAMPSGEQRTYEDILNAFSLYFGVLMIALAVLVWISSKSPETLKPSLIVSAVVMIVTAFITFKYAILPPLIMMLIVAVCFLLSALLAKNAE